MNSPSSLGGLEDPSLFIPFLTQQSPAVPLGWLSLGIGYLASTAGNHTEKARLSLWLQMGAEVQQMLSVKNSGPEE